MGEWDEIKRMAVGRSVLGVHSEDGKVRVDLSGGVSLRFNIEELAERASLIVGIEVEPIRCLILGGEYPKREGG